MLVDPSGDGSVERIRDDLPAAGVSITRLDLDGDGRDELMLGLPGELRIYGGGSTGRPWRDEPRRVIDEAFSPAAGRIATARAAGFLAASELGRLTLWGPVDGGAALGRVFEVDLPVEGKVTSSGLRVTGQPARFAGTRTDGTRVFVTAPQAFGGRRMKILRIDVPAEGPSRTTECWTAFPEPEDLLESEFLWLDDEPLLIAVTKPAGKLALFGEKRVRLFRLVADRGRTGYAPLFAVESRANLWQDIVPSFSDTDGDGRDDLVLGYWKGLKDSRVVLDVYLRSADGSFATGARTTAFDVKDGYRGYLEYGHDPTGDGLADLLILDQNDRVLVFPGQASKRGANVVDRDGVIAVGIPGSTASEEETVVSVGSNGMQTWTSGAAGSTMRFVTDFGGDGREVFVCVDPNRDKGRTDLTLVRF